jgi:GNAT superfamily N-acetyltransferase
MQASSIILVQVESPEHKDAARTLITEYLLWVAAIAQSQYGLSFDVESMVQSDLADATKFYPPSGRFYLVRYAGTYVGVGCLKRLAEDVGEIQRMYLQPHMRGLGGGRKLVMGLLQDAATLGYTRVRLESLKALTAAHGLYRSVGFVDIDPYADNSMKSYQASAMHDTYRQSAVFMECSTARCPK